jgi:iron complex outermembrane recepter protein
MSSRLARRLSCSFVGLFVSFGAAAATNEASSVEEIVVTGSYIKRDAANSPSPLSVVDRTQIEEIGAVTIADVVNTMTYNSGSTNITNAFSGSDNSTGNTNINLRNLGLGATLVLLNGRRQVPTAADSGGNGYVDLSQLTPTIAIQRVEVVKDGASALYGSDAIAGVVNFITRNDFEGVEFYTQASGDQETKDQRDYDVAGIAGVQGENGSVVVSAEYLNRQPLTINDRYSTYGRTGVSTLGNPGTFVPTGASLGPYLAGGGVASGLGGLVAGDVDCGLANSVSRNSYTAPDFKTPWATSLEALGDCTYDFSPFFSLVGKETRFLTLTEAKYRLSDGVEAYGEFGYAHQEFSRGNSLFPLVRFPTIPVTSPGLINDFARRSAALTGNPNAIPVTPTTFFGRVLGFGPTTSDQLRPVDTDTRQNADLYRAVVGFRGDLPFSNWTFDGSFNFSEQNADARNTDTRQQQLQLAVNGYGGPNCNPVPGTTPGTGNDNIPGNGECYYWNPFYSAFFTPTGAPQTDPALINPTDLIRWMVGEIRSQVRSNLTVGDFVMTGDLGLATPAGEIGVAIGFQVRENQVQVEVDDDSNANNYSFIYGAQDYNAKERAYAGFIELAVPITDRIDLQVAGRYEDFDVSGENSFDPKATLLYRTPLDGLTLRGSVGTSFRTGSLLQQFGTSTQLINIADPFSGAGLAFRPQLGIGNPDLKPESATVWNVGFSWKPEEGLFEGMFVDADYYNYTYDDLITLEGPADLVNRDTASRCPQGLNNANSATFNPALPACGYQGVGNPIISVGPGLPNQVIRDDQLNFLRVTPTYSNAQKLDVDGVDFTVGYSMEMGNFGILRPQITGSWARTWDLETASGTTIHGSGSRNFGTTIGRSLPEYKVNLNINWVLGRNAVNVLVRYIDSYEDNQPYTVANSTHACLGSCLRAFSTGHFSLVGATPQSIDNTIASFTTVDMQYSYTLPAMGAIKEGSVISVGGTNVFNREPPVLNFDGGFDPFVADPRGAVWYARFTMDL